MLKSVEGVYRHGAIELSEVPSDIVESRVIVTFLEANLEAKGATQTEQMMYFGMFAGSEKSTEDDFRVAEFYGDTDDGLSWS